MRVAAVALLQLLAATPPQISSPRVLDSPAVTPKPYSVGQLQPAGLLGGPPVIVWTDDRFGTNNVFFSRLDPLGALLDGAGMGVALSPSGAPQVVPRVGCNATQCLVVWGDQRRSAAFPALRAGRVAADGTALDATPLTLDVLQPTGGPVGIASDGVDFLVVWTTPSGAGVGIRAARVSAAGAVLDATPLIISSDGSSASVTFDGQSYLVGWSTSASDALHWATVSPAGQVGAPLGPPSDGGFRFLWGIASDAVTTLAAWYELPNSNVRAGRIARDGGLLDPNGLVVMAGTNASVAALDGGGFVIAARDSTNQAYVLSFADDGTFDAGPRPIDAGSVGLPALGCGGSLCLLTKGQTGVLLRPDLSVAASFVFGASVPRGDPDTEPATACTQGFCLASWHTGSTPQQVWVQRLGLDGTLRDPTPILFGQGPISAIQLATSGTDFMATWANGTVPYAQRISLNVTAPAYFRYGAFASATSVGHDGNEYVLASADVTGVGVIPRLQPAGPDGGVADDAGFDLCPMCTPNSQLQQLHLVGLGGTTFGAWGNFIPSATGGRTKPLVARLLPDGGVPEPAAITLSGTTTAGLTSIAASDAGVMVVWTESADGGGDVVLAARVDVSGTVLDAPAVVVDAFTSWKANAVVAWDGAEWLVAWVDARRSGRNAIMGCALDPNATPLGASAEWTDEATNIGRIALGSEGFGQTLLLYEFFDPATASWRISRRIIGRLPVGDPCAGGAACVSATCVSGVCCTAGCDAGTCAGGVCGAGMSGSDAGTDAGTSQDGGVLVDGGSTPDAGPPNDAGTTTEPDAGLSERNLRVGCGCDAGGAWLGGLPLVLALRRRRRSS